MANHGFGIMPVTPGKKRYDTCDPEKYGCIFLDDDDLSPLLPEFEHIPCYWHTRLRPEYNLDYCGITLIPPSSASLFAEVWRRQDGRQFEPVLALFERGIREEKFIIHYGL